MLVLFRIHDRAPKIGDGIDIPFDPYLGIGLPLATVPVIS